MSDEESNEYQLREDGLKVNDHLRAASSGNLRKMWKLHDHKKPVPLFFFFFCPNIFEWKEMTGTGMS